MNYDEKDVKKLVKCGNELIDLFKSEQIVAKTKHVRKVIETIGTLSEPFREKPPLFGFYAYYGLDGVGLIVADPPIRAVQYTDKVKRRLSADGGVDRAAIHAVIVDHDKRANPRADINATNDIVWLIAEAGVEIDG